MSYTPNNFDITNPTDAIVAETAQAEFRNIKSFFQGVMGRISGVFSLVSTLATTVIFSVLIPGNSMGSNRAIRYTLTGIISNGTGSSQVIGIAVGFGSAVVISNANINIPNNGGFTFKIIGLVVNRGSTNSQNCSIETHLFNNASNMGVSQSEVSGYPTGGMSNIATIDTTGNQSFQVFATLSASDPTFILDLEQAILEWL